MKENEKAPGKLGPKSSSSKPAAPTDYQLWVRTINELKVDMV